MNVAYSNLFRYLALVLVSFSAGYLFHANNEGVKMVYLLLLVLVAVFAAIDYKEHLAPPKLEKI